MKTLTQAIKDVKGLIPYDQMETLDFDLHNEGIQLNDGTLCKSDHLHKLIKIKTIRDCKRLDSIDFEDQYHIDLGNRYGKVIDIGLHNNIHYFLFVESNGDVSTLQVKKLKSSVRITLDMVARTCSDCNRHNCCDINGSKHLFGQKRNAQIYQHVIVGIAYGLYDGLNVDEIYSLLINHMDGDMFNNNINNLELCTSKENSIHSIILSYLKTKGFSGKLKASVAVKLYDDLPVNGDITIK